MASFDPTSLIGRTYLTLPTDQGLRDRGTILEIVPEQDAASLSNPALLKLRCEVNDGEKKWDQIVTVGLPVYYTGAYGLLIKLTTPVVDH